jgi:hypothetical protein
VVVFAAPSIVVVTTLVAVVLAVQPDHVVQGADVPQGPAVQPGQSDAGHALPPHQAVHGAERQSLRVDQSDHGPQLELPQGPGPSLPMRGMSEGSLVFRGRKVTHLPSVPVHRVLRVLRIHGPQVHQVRPRVLSRVPSYL